MRQLRDLPKDLEQSYQQLLCRTSQPEDLLMILRWVVFSARPITLQELAEVVTVDFSPGDRPCYDGDLRYMDPRDVVTVCSGFLTKFQGKAKMTLYEPFFIIGVPRYRQAFTHVRQGLSPLGYDLERPGSLL